MEKEVGNDSDRFFYKFCLNDANREVPMNDTKELVRDDSENVSTCNVANAGSSSMHPSFKERDKDEKIAALKHSASAPGKPRASKIGCNFIRLEWEKPTDRDISYYEIRFKNVLDPDWCRPVFSEFDEPCFMMRRLVPNTEYEFIIRAHYEYKEGPFSQKSDPIQTKKSVDEITASTSKSLTRKSGKPIPLDAKENSIQLRWDKPEEKNVSYYEIKYKSAQDDNWSKSLFTENANTFSRVNGLLPETEYRFRVKSHHQTFEGEFSDVSDAIETKATGKVSVSLTSASFTRPGKPAALDVGVDYACIAWDKPDRCDAEYYEVRMKTTVDELWFKTPSFTEKNNPYTTITDLVCGQEYEFKVRCHFQKDNDEGVFSEKSDPIKIKQPFMLKADLRTVSRKESLRKPGKPCSLAAGCDFIDLMWDIPGDKSVIYYELKTKTANKKAWDKMPAVTNDAKSFCRMRGLVPSTQYVFKVRAHFIEEEEGEYSDVSDIIITSTDLRQKDAEQNPTSLVKFQERKTHQEDFGLRGPSAELTQQRQLKHSDIPEHCPLNGREGADHGSKHVQTRQPSKPTPSEVGSDFILLDWTIKKSESVLYYEIKYRPTRDELWIRDSVTTKDRSPKMAVRGLLQDTGYTFKVRAHYRDGEGEFSESSDSIHTIKSPALSVRNLCIKLKDGEPAFYKIPLTENKAARNAKHKTRKCEFGSTNLLKEKTIMMIGATGSGKSTLIDGMVNHLMGVKWEDDFRFKIIDLMAEEKAKQGRETVSQTDWITSYRVHPVIETVKFICNIIDTPGFGDTRGIQRDHQLVDQIRAFFDTKGVTGIETIDAICFVTQAPLARLTHTQRYIYESILSIFGKDMKDNIVAMITFADGKEPPVLNALKTAEVPVKKHFLFNNSALFEPNTEGKCNRFGKMFWDMGSLSYGGFFDSLPQMKTQSLQLTAEVLLNRDQLNAIVAGLLPQIDIGLGNLETMRQERALLMKFSREIADNKNFTYEVDEFHQNKITLKPGEYVTNCTYCHFTCHYPCFIPEDSEKSNCFAMTDGICRVCPEKCKWDLHRNNDFRIEVVQMKVTKTYEEMKAKFEIAEKGKLSKQHIFLMMRRKFISVKNNVYSMLDSVRYHGNYLRQNAIKSNPLTELEYLDVLIKSEDQQKKPGFQARIEMLQSFRRCADIKAKTTRMSTDDFLTDMGFHDFL